MYPRKGVAEEVAVALVAKAAERPGEGEEIVSD